MCLVVVAFRQHDSLPLIIAANRDEFHSRPTEPAGWWRDRPDVIGGRDLEAGGSWLAMHKNGRVAFVTNQRDARRERPGLRSRGELVTTFLESRTAPADYLATIDTQVYAGFNLLVADGEQLAYLSNRGGGLRELGPGIYGQSNATLDEPWTKVVRTKARLASMIESDDVDEDRLLAMLADPDRGTLDEAQSNGLSPDFAHALTAPFIVTPEYGTRCSTVVSVDAQGHARFVERRFDAAGRQTGESRFEFELA